MSAPRKKKSQRFDNIVKRDWDLILKQVDKKEIPVELLEAVVINLIDGTQININIKDLIDEGMTSIEIEHRLSSQIVGLDNYIKEVDFHIIREKVVDTISLTTKELLKRVR